MENVYIYFGFIFVAVAVIAYPKMKIYLGPKVKSNLVLYSILASILLGGLLTLFGYYFIIIRKN